MVELVTELEKLPKSDQINLMIKEAKAGEYHDYKNVKYICGKMESSQRLRRLGFNDLAKRIEQGEFDEEADEQDRKIMRDELKGENNGEALINILGLGEKND